MAVDLKRLADALRMQRDHARVLLEHPDRDVANFHLAIAGVLRSMLCDADWPTLIILAREMAIDLRVWGPYPATAINFEPPSFVFNALTASAESVFEGYEMSAKEYLDAPIGAISVEIIGDARLRSSWYTPRQLIKWAANKEGASHFDPKPAATFQSIGSSIVAMGSVSMISPTGSTPITENDNLILRMGLIQIAQVSVILANNVLARYDNDI